MLRQEPGRFTRPERAGTILRERRFIVLVVSDRTGYICTECDWAVNVQDPEEASQLAIEHYIESGHSVEREDDPDVHRRGPIWSAGR